MVRICVREVNLTLVSYTHHNYYVGMNVCFSTYKNGCVVNGMGAMAAD